MTTTTDEVSCPKCGGNMWDNRATKRNSKAPDYKCRNRSCDGVIWPPKNGAAPAAKPSNEKKPFNAGPYTPAIDGDENPYAQGESQTSDSQGMTKGTAVALQYEATLVWVLKHVTPKLTAADIPVDGAAVNSMVATILIQASK